MRYDDRFYKPMIASVFAAACVFAALPAGTPLVASSQTVPSATLAPTALPSPTLPAQPSPPSTPLPEVTPSPVATPTILMLPPDAPPYILWYQLSSTTPHAGDVITGIVLTSSNVASVEVRVGGYGFNLPKTGVGRFEWKFQVPRLPFFVSHKMTMEIIARNTAGAQTGASFPFQIL